MDQRRRRSLHEFDDRADRVGHVHHVHARVRFERAGVATAVEGAVEDLDGVVGCAAARGCRVGDQTREAQTPGVNAEAHVVVVAEELPRHLGHAVHGRGALQGGLGGRVAGGSGPEGRDRAGREDPAAGLGGHLQHIDQAVHVDAVGAKRIRLRGRRQDGRKVEDVGGAETGDGAPQRRQIEAVQLFGGAPPSPGDGVADIGRQGHARPVAVHEAGGQFGPDLTGGAGDENALHGWECGLHPLLRSRAGRPRIPPAGT